MSELAKIIGHHIRRLRRDHALTQGALAKRLGVNSSYIGPLEKGLKTPSLSTLERLSTEFSVPVYSFFFLDEAEERSAVDRIRALVGSRPPEEREFLVKTVEEMVKLLRRNPRRCSEKAASEL
jgi:transcriptional regulator with XRE-family HTH domain